MLQAEKKIVPEPQLPDMGGSSPWCGMKLHTLGLSPVLQNPFLLFRRSALHLRGQMQQDLSS